MQTHETKSKKASAGKNSEQGTDATKFLESQHREVDELFEEFEGAGERAHKTKEKIIATICEKLILHARIEEEVFYPAVKAIDEDLVLEAAEEHANVKAMIAKLEGMSSTDETFTAKATVLKELVEHHVKEEEKELFPKCRKALSDEDLKEIGTQLEAKTEQYEQMN